jgi:hypothetical protein
MLQHNNLYSIYSLFGLKGPLHSRTIYLHVLGKLFARVGGLLKMGSVETREGKNVYKSIEYKTCMAINPYDMDSTIE